MQRPCNACSKPYEAKRPQSKFCSTACRVRANQTKAKVVPISEPESTDGPLTTATAAELSAAGRLDTRAGQQALVLARRMDSQYASDAALAPLSKALTDVMAKALDGVKVAADPLDELRARRAAKSAG